MNRRRVARFALLVVPSLLACADPPPPPAAAPVEDEWSRAPSPAWLVATHGASAAHPAECAASLAWLEKDEGCAGAACGRAAALGKEWLTRCPKIDDAHAARVKELVTRFTERADQAPSACDEQAEAMLRDGCRKASCVSSAQTWATRCAARLKSPLTVRFVERLVERKIESEERIELDPRSCDALGAEVLPGAGCRDQFACADAFKKFDVVRERCTDAADLPTVAVGAVAVSMAAGAKQKPPRIRVRAGASKVTPAESALALGDGSGVAVAVCDDRPAAVDEYVAARAACKNGQIDIARAFSVGDAVEVRFGKLAFPDDATFEARFPTIHLAGEVEARDRRSAGALAGVFAGAAAEGRGAKGLAAALRALRTAFDHHGGAVRRATSPLPGEEALAPLFAELGRAKRARASASGAGDASGILARGRTRPLADIDEKGGVKAGAASPAGRIDATKALPSAMRAYVAALDPGGRGGAPRVDAATANKARATGLERARACAESEKRLQSFKATLVSCAFELESCAPDKLAEATAAVDDGMVAAAAAWDAFDTARTGAASAFAGELTDAAQAAGCREPWW
jgi:hypothetical protein